MILKIAVARIKASKRRLYRKGVAVADLFPFYGISGIEQALFRIKRGGLVAARYGDPCAKKGLAQRLALNITQGVIEVGPDVILPFGLGIGSIRPFPRLYVRQEQTPVVIKLFVFLLVIGLIFAQKGYDGGAVCS